MVSKWLMDIARYNVEYMVNLAQMATDFLGALVGAAVEAATVVEIPFTVDALVKVRDLMSQMSDPNFKNGIWPQAVTG